VEAREARPEQARKQVEQPAGRPEPARAVAQVVRPARAVAQVVRPARAVARAAWARRLGLAEGLAVAAQSARVAVAAQPVEPWASRRR
jgi:hypothetical protein